MAENKELVKTNETIEKNIGDNVLNRLNTFEKQGSVKLPVEYSAGNALKSAYLILRETKDSNKKCVLESCTKESIANSLLDMCIQGLSPVKKQCYFIAYGDKLQLSRSYLGNIAVTKRLKDVNDVFANIIYDGDTFEYEINLETGLKKITKHEQSFENIDITKIKGAYAVIVRESKDNYVEVMNINQIRNSWNQGSMKGSSGAHKNFTDEMVKKTVINRACKIFQNTSDDSDLLIDVINRTEEKDELEVVSNQVIESANKEIIDIQEELPVLGIQENKEEAPEF